MKLLLLNILLILATYPRSETDLGIGLVSINYDDKTTLQFYKDLNDKEPAKTIEFFNDLTINSWNIRHLEEQKEWLQPEILWLDYSSLVFRCLTKKGNWFQIVTNNETGETYWLKKSELTSFSDWENYLKEMFGVARLSNREQKIRILPTGNSDAIDYHGQDCFQVKSMKGDWIEIFTPDYCEDNTNIQSGWIKWKEGNKLLIDYFITS